MILAWLKNPYPGMITSGSGRVRWQGQVRSVVAGAEASERSSAFGEDCGGAGAGNLGAPVCRYPTRPNEPEGRTHQTGH